MQFINMRLKTTIQNEGQTITVVGYYPPPYKGARDEYGAPMEPDDDESIEIIFASDETGDEIELTPDQEGEALANLWEQGAD